MDLDALDGAAREGGRRGWRGAGWRRGAGGAARGPSITVWRGGGGQGFRCGRGAALRFMMCVERRPIALPSTHGAAWRDLALRKSNARAARSTRSSGATPRGVCFDPRPFPRTAAGAWGSWRQPLPFPSNLGSLEALQEAPGSGLRSVFYSRALGARRLAAYPGIDVCI